MRLMEFEELRGGKDAGYWTNYVARFGVDHLVNPTHKMGYRQVYDLDIKLIVTTTVILSVLTLWSLVQMVLNLACRFKFK